MTLVVRPKPRDRDNPDFFTEKMLPWPEDAVSASREGFGGDWHYRTVADVLREKRERQEGALRQKRAEGVIQRRAVFVWSFWCPGVAGFAFRGWWMYLRGIGGTLIGGGHKGSLGPELFAQVRPLFPVRGQTTLFGPIRNEDYAEAFASAYQRGTHCGRPQGLAPCWAVIEPYGRVAKLEKVR